MWLTRLVLSLLLLPLQAGAAWAQLPQGPAAAAPVDLRAVAAGPAGVERRAVRLRLSDSLLNGALIGAGAGVASGLLLCRATEPWENCRDDVGPMLLFGALGAGIGTGIDALLRREQTMPPGGRSGLVVRSLAGRRLRGLQLVLRF
jgi:hypothetical protein